MNFMNSKNITQEQFDSMTLPLDTKYGILTETSLSAAEELILRCFCLFLHWFIKIFVGGDQIGQVRLPDHIHAVFGLPSFGNRVV